MAPQPSAFPCELASIEYEHRGRTQTKWKPGFALLSIAKLSTQKSYTVYDAHSVANDSNPWKAGKSSFVAAGPASETPGGNAPSCSIMITKCRVRRVRNCVVRVMIGGDAKKVVRAADLLRPRKQEHAALEDDRVLLVGQDEMSTEPHLDFGTSVRCRDMDDVNEFTRRLKAAATDNGDLLCEFIRGRNQDRLEDEDSRKFRHNHRLLRPGVVEERELKRGDVVVYSGSQVTEECIENSVDFFCKSPACAIDRLYFISSSNCVKVGYTGDSFYSGRAGAYKTHTPDFRVIGVVVVCAKKSESASKTTIDNEIKNLADERHPGTRVKGTEWFRVDSNLFTVAFEVLGGRCGESMKKAKAIKGEILEWEKRAQRRAEFLAEKLKDYEMQPLQAGVEEPESKDESEAAARNNSDPAEAARVSVSPLRY
jgi:hypothetical protein